MNIAPTLCPRCLAEKRIATANGPTCTHAQGWFPPTWDKMGEAGRLVWITKQQKEQKL